MKKSFSSSFVRASTHFFMRNQSKPEKPQPNYTQVLTPLATSNLPKTLPNHPSRHSNRLSHCKQEKVAGIEEAKPNSYTGKIPPLLA